MSKDLVISSYNEGKQSFGKNDLQPSYATGIAVVSGTNKLAQDILKILLTERGTNTADANYGTSLMSMIGKKQVLSSLYVDVKKEVIDAVKYYMDINSDLTEPTERIATIKSLEVTKTDPRSYEIALILTTEAGTDVRINTGVGV